VVSIGFVTLLLLTFKLQLGFENLSILYIAMLNNPPLSSHTYHQIRLIYALTRSTTHANACGYTPSLLQRFGECCSEKRDRDGGIDRVGVK